jgi:DNA ligase-associated metallophosphoesterase
MFSNAQAFNLKHQRFWLMPEKAMYWQKKKTLLIADLHIGKSGHFRKHGIAVPDQVNKSNLDELDELLHKTSPEHLLILGDLFHSDINREWQQFTNWRKTYQQLEISLVIGNHDILDTEKYHAGIINVFHKLTLNPFLLVHDIDEIAHREQQSHYILSGHIHPAVQLSGQARQRMKLPCFYFGSNYGILPAFGRFTGTHVIEPNEQDDVFLIVNNKIMAAHKLNN